MEPLLILLIVGAIAGWAAGVIVKGYGYGLFGNIVVGVIGSVIGGMVFSGLGPLRGGGMLSTLVCATLGAVILLFLLRFIRRIA